VEKQLREIEIHLAEIKKDLRYHIKRTDQLEKIVVPIHKSHVFISYSIKALAPLGVLIGILFQLKEHF